MTAFLTRAELETLTGKQRPSAQRRALDRMRVPHLIRPDGRPVVTTEAVNGNPATNPTPTEPNWAALGI